MTTVYYLNNFRGFKDTMISFEQVNFLVGENSTGKTSIISLLSLLNNPNFWYGYDFNLEDANLGSFEDIRSKNTTSNYFTIGQFSVQSQKEKMFIGILLKFRNENGLPVLYENILISNQDIAFFRFDKGSIKYTFRQISSIAASESPEENARILLHYLRNTRFRSNSLKFVKLATEDNRPLLYHSSLILGKDKAFKKFSYWQYMPYVHADRLSLMAPIRAKPKPIYMSIKSAQTPEGDHTPFIFKSLSESGKNSKFFESLNRFGKDSGLFDSIEARSFGKSKISPFELDVIKSGKRYKISSVGYGVSQIFPILIDILVKPSATLFAIQQPEVHLHPKAQAAFGELLYHVAMVDNKRFIIETHSDYLIDRYRYTVYQNQKNKIPSQVLFFENNCAVNKISNVVINTDGTYPEVQPEGFRDFFINESIKLMEI